MNDKKMIQVKHEHLCHTGALPMSRFLQIADELRAKGFNKDPKAEVYFGGSNVSASGKRYETDAEFKQRRIGELKEEIGKLEETLRLNNEDLLCVASLAIQDAQPRCVGIAVDVTISLNRYEQLKSAKESVEHVNNLLRKNRKELRELQS
jgi:hypothetical protein